nr:V-type ATPase subunit [Modestobacter marinus]
MGNTRLRARWHTLLDGPARARLAGRDLPGLVAGLRGTAHGAFLGAVTGTGRDDRPAVLRAVEERRRTALRGVGQVYRERAGEVVAVLLARYDLADTLTLLRGAAHHLPEEDVLAALHGVGAVTPTAAREVVAEEPEAVVQRLTAARLPDPGTARALAGAWDRYLLHGDLPELETAVARAASARADGRLAELGRPAERLRRFLADERDAANLLSALRCRNAGRAPEALPERLLPPGQLSVGALVAVAAGGGPPPGLPAAWRGAVDRALATGRAAELAGELEEHRAQQALAGWRTGDPLGVDVPLGFTAAVEVEARELRRVVLLAEPGSGEPEGPAGPAATASARTPRAGVPA